MDKQLKNLYAVLDRTAKLAQYLTSPFDLNLDNYDPSVNTFIRVASALEDPRKIFESRQYALIMVNGIRRVVTPDVRAELYRTLSGLRNSVKAKELRILDTTLMALEDLQLQASLIGLVRDIFHENIMRCFMERAENAEKEPAEDLKKLVHALRKEFSNDDIEQALEHSETVLILIDKELDDESLTDEERLNLVKTMARIPTHQSAALLYNLLFDDWIDVEELLGECGEELTSLIATHLLNELEIRNTNFFETWTAYTVLTEIRDFRVFDHLRVEFSQEMTYDQDLEALVDFYNDLAEMLCEFEDRRAIPTFIQFMYDGKRQGFSDEIIEGVREALIQSPWYDEIVSGVNLLREGELVIVRAGEEFIADAKRDMQERNAARAVFQSDYQPVLSDLQQDFSRRQKRWNEAYHEDLDGLRPVDVPVSRVKTRLMREMMNAAQNLASLSAMSPEEVSEFFAEFQDSWLITPSASCKGRVPMAVIYEDETRLATTEALKAHAARYRSSRVNSLYLEAKEYFEDESIDECEKRLDAILQIEPDHPFAQMLKEKLTEQDEEA